MVIQTVYHFVDSNLGVEYPQKRGVNRKERQKLFCLGGANDLPWGKKSLFGGSGVGGNYTD